MTAGDAARLGLYGALAGARMGLAAAGHVVWLVRHHVLERGDPR